MVLVKAAGIIIIGITRMAERGFSSQHVRLVNSHTAADLNQVRNKAKAKTNRNDGK